MLARPATLDNERGAIAVFTVFFIALVLIPALVWLSYDVAGWRAHRRHLQLQADAAAFAAGDQFGECFADNSTTPPGPLPTAQADMEAKADQYVGIPTLNPASLYNLQLPGGGSMNRNYNSLSYPSPGGFTTSDGTDTRASCTSDMFDVKLSEDLSLFGLVPLPGIYAHAHARVSLVKIKGATGELPLAVPDTNPTHVTVTLVDMTGGTQSQIGSPVDLANMGPDNTKISQGVPLTKWTGNVPLSSVPNGTVGIRVGVGSSSGTCLNVSGGPGYGCYDADASNIIPLAAIRGYPTDNASTTQPWLGPASETTCAGAINPLFSDVDTSSTCSATLSGTAHFLCPAAATCKVTATDAGGTQSRTLAGTTQQPFSFSYSYLIADGQEPVTLGWTISPASKCGGAGQMKCSGTFGPPTTTPMWGNGSGKPVHQQAYSADSNLDATGPIKVLSVSPCCSLPAGSSQMLTVTVELVGSFLNEPVPTPTVALRFSGSASRSSTVACDPGVTVQQSIITGCTTPYQINTAGVCPDTASPADCVPVKTGSGGITIYNALNTRFGVSATCTVVNNWPTVTPGDPRIVQTLIADLTQILGRQGAGTVPVVNFATFYITGWGFFRSHTKKTPGCPGEEAPPAELDTKSTNGFTAIWGHFIEYNQTQDIPGDQNCGSPTITPCVLELSQ